MANADSPFAPRLTLRRALRFSGTRPGFYFIFSFTLPSWNSRAVSTSAIHKSGPTIGENQQEAARSQISSRTSPQPSIGYLKRISNTKLSRNSASRIYQLVTSHVPLNAYLSRFKLVENAQRPTCGAANEDSTHFLLHCPTYPYERWPLVCAAGMRVKPLTTETKRPTDSTQLSRQMSKTPLLTQTTPNDVWLATIPLPPHPLYPLVTVHARTHPVLQRIPYSDEGGTRATK